MIDKICEYLTNQIRRKNPDISEEKAEVINYGIHLLVGEIPKTFVFIAIAILLGVLKEFFITMLVIFPYRAFSGGFHLRTHLGCILATSVMYCGIPFVSQYIVIGRITKYIVIASVWIFSIIMCKLYAPADTTDVPVLRKKDRRMRKMMSYIILTITLIIGMLIQDRIISNIVILGIFVQSITISRFAFKITKNQYGHEVYLQTKEAIN